MLVSHPGDLRFSVQEKFNLEFRAELAADLGIKHRPECRVFPAATVLVTSDDGVTSDDEDHNRWSEPASPGRVFLMRSGTKPLS
jgi:hypothetical protein